MLSRTFAVLVISMSVVMCGSTRGSITAFWQQVTITPAAISNDPALANMQCWDLITTTTGNWADARMAATLPTGLAYYKHSLGTLPRPAPGAVSAAPALAFTTFVSSPSDDGTNGATIVLFGHPQSQLAPNLGDATSLIPGFFSMRWADTFFTVDPPGTYQVARLTFPLGVIPDVLQGEDPSRINQLDPSATVFIVDIPEARAWALIGIGCCLGMQLRNRRPRF